MDHVSARHSGPRGWIRRAWTRGTVLGSGRRSRFGAVHRGAHRRHRLALLVLAFSLPAAGVLGGCAGPDEHTAASADVLSAATTPCPEPASTPGAGTNLPALALSCLGGPTTVELRQLPAKPVVLNLWASWCGPCRQEMPTLQKVHEAAGDQVLFLGIATRDQQDSARAFVADFGVTYASLYDRSGSALSKLGAPGLPLTLVLAADGTVVDRKVGGIEQDRLVADLEKARVRLDGAGLDESGGR